MPKPLRPFILIAVLAAAAPALAQTAAVPKPAGPDPQKLLDFMAGFPLPDKPAQPGDPYLPHKPFADWSVQERSDATLVLTRLCYLFWRQAHTPPDLRLLPPVVPPADEEALGPDVCLVGHMPADWPERAATLGAARRILAEARGLGSSLALPKPLDRPRP